MAHVFISYSRKNQQYARQLAEDIRKRGFDVWIDDRIDYGDRWWRTIVQAIQVCGAFVVVMSPSAEESEWVEREVLLAQRHQKPIFPLLLDGDVFSLLITTQFANVVDGSLPQDDFYERLRKAVTPQENSGAYVAPSEPQSEPTPTPESQPATTARRVPIVWIGAAVTLIVVLIAAVMLVNAVIGGNGSNATLTGFEQLQTLEAQRTQSAAEQAAFALTITQQGIRDSNATATAVQFGVTETLAYATLFPLSPSWTPLSLVTNTGLPPLLPTTTQFLLPVQPTFVFIPSPTFVFIPTSIGTINMVQVPPGCFDMGESGEGGRQCFDAPFWIGQTEVTNAQYAEFVSAGGYNEQRYWTDAGWAWKTENNRTAPENYNGFTDNNQPRVGVSWYEAVAYTHWLTEQLRASGAIGQDEEVRLPTESEWEYAARGPDGLAYPWGNDFDGTRLNFCDANCTNEWRNTSFDDSYGMITAPVGSYPLGASWVGALDMSGNVWEWSLSGYADYPYVGTDGRNDISENITYRVLRGGSFFRNQYYAAASYRSYHVPGNDRDHYGVRLVLSARR